MAEAHGVFLAIPPDRQIEIFGERVDDRNADAVQTAGNLVGILVEFSAGMQLGHDDFRRGNTFVLMDILSYPLR